MDWEDFKITMNLIKLWLLLNIKSILNVFILFGNLTLPKVQIYNAILLLSSILHELAVTICLAQEGSYTSN